MNKVTGCVVICVTLCLAVGPQIKYHMLQNLEADARTALKAGDTATATKYASELLEKNAGKSPFNYSWNYGNVVYEGNQILGLAALKEGRIAAAKQYLIAAGHTPGSPTLDSFGPEMILAQELLKKGEKQVVLDFLDLVAGFWATPKASTPDKFLGMYKSNAAKIQRWKAEIRAGKNASLDACEVL